MSNKSDSEKNLDPNFQLAISTFNSLNINYWVCHGSLLGLVRDGNLISWDTDIDIAVFKSEISIDEIRAILTNVGFQDRGGDHGNSLHLKREGGKFVDINFYEISRLDNNKSEAAVYWKISKNFFLWKLINHACDTQEYSGKYKVASDILKKFRFFFYPFKLVLDIWKITYSLKGYAMPSEYLEKFEFISILNLKCRVPKRYEEICEELYGQDWKIPKQQYNWITDSLSTKEKK